MSFIVFANGLVLLGLAAVMGVIGIFFPLSRTVFLESALLAGFIGLCLVLVASSDRRGLQRLHAFLLTASVWIVAALAGALPLWLWGLRLPDAIFEAVSGITTTGSTVMVGLDNTEHGILLWRSILQWIGGVGFIVAGIALMPIMRVGGMQLFRTESSERGDKEMTSAALFAGATVWIYLGLTALCTVVYMAGGMLGFDALSHAFTTVSTGGYSTSDASFGQFESSYLQWSATGFMLAGALPFAWYIRLLRRGSAQSEQVRTLFLGLAVAILVITTWRVLEAHTPIMETLRLVSFNVVSVVTTTGYATVDYTAWGPFAATAFLLLTVISSCTGSTSGGGKIMRWIIFARATVVQARAVHNPHGVFKVRYEGQAVGDDVVSGVISFFVLYAGTVFALAWALGLIGLDATTAVSGALTAVANVGPGIGGVIGPAGNFSSLPDPAKWLLSFGMYAGRLEMLTVYVILLPSFWRELPR
ncbi:TrkH family potassium uptake protein [Histidinibacterium aquaticum]|uniref:Trk system potassium uptake protein n=1 Tax=Histidinibacterium aquaticum TaxID=2613962 RepID=A0A5J5GPD8_9RHOB|nr:TrkH family potassium uptake protein [Histidinibacterium aquaticum]KAA9010161.1 TrkH family potassium uptake protein [Histidinibacterium aquaticum]